MSSQQFKTINYPGDGGGQFTLVFGAKETDLHASVNILTSLEIRKALGYDTLDDLKVAAEQARVSLNLFCKNILDEKLTIYDDEIGQLNLPGFPATPDPILDPLHATFRGGSTEPFHNWFPFLEGYSPEFVRTVIKRYAPNARSVLDPFSGTGTSAITATSLGIKAFFCEINPVLQFVTRVKSEVAILPLERRRELRGSLEAISNNLDDRLPGRIDEKLGKDFLAVFGESNYFGFSSEKCG